MSSKDIRDLLDRVREQGFTIRSTGSGHYLVSGRRGRVVLPSTPSSSRTSANMRAALRRIGVRL